MASSSSNEPFFKHLHTSQTNHVLLTAETDDFDDEITRRWKDQGFQVIYVPFGDGGGEYIRRLHGVAGRSVGVSERYAIVAFGDAATACLQAHTSTVPRLSTLIAYYPSTIPDPQKTSFPPNLHVLLHLVGSSIGVLRRPEILGIQSNKTKTVQRKMHGGIGLGGGMTLNQKFNATTYFYGDGCESGFAESDLDEFRSVETEVAFERSLRVVREGFGIGEKEARGIERIWDEFGDATVDDPETALESLDSNAHVLHTPTMTGGFDSAALDRFYTEYFSPSADLLTTKLLSRTIGTTRIVDEVHVSFKHSREIPWILPSIPPTDKTVEIVVVTIANIEGSRIKNTHIYWDQASVLVQIGLLDPEKIPGSVKGVKKLPVVGKDATRAVLEGKGQVRLR